MRAIFATSFLVSAGGLGVCRADAHATKAGFKTTAKTV
jgi:hypothetical protein